MAFITKKKILDGVYFVEIPEVDLRILCGCPADSIKHLGKKGLLPLVEKDGILFESGPNAILLADTPVQNGMLSNVSEFPVLHMFYTQGMILSDHPNYAQKPLMIGIRKYVLSQMEYIFLGNYGLTKEEDYLALGESLDFTRETLRMKLRFAQGKFIPTRELMEGIFLNSKPVELKPGVKLRRLRENVFFIQYKRQSVTVDLNLKEGQTYKAPYRLRKRKIPNHYFAVIHSGEGDGWDPKRPCLSGIVVFDKKIFLIDSGPNILKSLSSLSIDPERIEGIFFTHVHDDHFAGLHSLLNRKRKIKIFSTLTVGATIFKKLSKLLSLSERELRKFLTHQPLERDQWNNYKGLEIKPLASAHPIDTTIFVFRAKTENGYKTYGHFSDIAALSWLRKMVVDSQEEVGISQETYETVKKTFGLKLDLKKIDIGGPAVHGDVEDFANDLSEKIVMGHTHAPYTSRQLEIGSEVKFGEVDVLISKKPVM